MKYIPPIFACGLLTAVALAQVQRNTVKDTTTSSETGGTSPSAVAHNASGQDLIRQAARDVVHLPPLQCKLRQQVRLLNHELVGSGTYRQVGQGDDTKIRLDLKIQLVNGLTTLTQVRNHRFLWTRRQFPNHSRLSRVDLHRVRQATQPHSQTSDPTGSWIALGGLPALLCSLEKHYRFSAPQSDSLGANQVGVYSVTGRWRANRNKSDRETAQNEPPAAFPMEVRVVLAKKNPVPLFPYRVEFRNLTSQPPGSTVIIEFFDARSLETGVPQLFSMNPGDEEIEDHTDTFLERLGLKSERSDRKDHP